MSINNILSYNYKKYKDHYEDEEKNGYSLSFEDFNNIYIESEHETDEPEYIDTDICYLSDDWTPVGRIRKKYKKALPERIIQYFIWIICLFGTAYICYHTISEVYRE
jgi:hypothetical protein